MTNFSASQLQEDLSYLIQVMNDLHPAAPNTPNPDKHWNFEDLFGQLGSSMSRIEFCRLVSPRVARLKDGHTWLDWEKMPEMESFHLNKNLHFPIQIKIEKNGIKIDQNEPRNDIIRKGNQITMINGLSSTNILPRLLAYSHLELDIPRYLHVTQHFSKLLWLEFGFCSPFEVEIQNAEGKRFTRILKNFDPKNRVNKVKSPLVYKVLEKQKVGLLKVYSFPVDKKGVFKLCLDRIFQEIKKTNIPTLIIDMRRCEGGDDVSGDYLLSYIAHLPFSQFQRVEMKVSGLGKKERRLFFSLETILNSYFLQLYFALPEGSFLRIDSEKSKLTPPHKYEKRYHGEVIVLAGPKTYSAGSSFVAAVKAYGIAPIVGAETGQPSVCFGATFQGTLPNTQIDFGVSTKKFTFIGGEGTNKGVVPDFQTDEDNALEFAFRNFIEFEKNDNNQWPHLGSLSQYVQDNSNPVPESDLLISLADDNYSIRESAIERLSLMDRRKLSEIVKSFDNSCPSARAGLAFVLGVRSDFLYEDINFLLNQLMTKDPLVRICTICALYKASISLPYLNQRLHYVLTDEKQSDIRWLLKELLKI